MMSGSNHWMESGINTVLESTPNAFPDAFPDALHLKVVDEQVRMIYKQGPILAAGAACAAVMITFFLWDQFAVAALFYWLAAVFCSALLRVMMFRAYWRVKNSSTFCLTRARYWGRCFGWGSFFSGLVWGLWPTLFYASYTPEYLLLISTIFAGMIAVLATSGSVYLPAFYAFAIPLVLPLAVFHVQSGVHFLVWTGWLLIMFFFVNLALAIRGNKHSVELIRARFKNNELMSQLSNEKQVAEQAVVAKNRFIACASHDLRQPLHAMSLLIAALGNSRLDRRQSSIVGDLQKSAIALSRLFSSLLDVSKLAANTVDVNNSDFHISTVFESLSADFHAEAKARGLELNFAMNSLVLHTDRMLLERILRNLLSNALRYTSEGRVSVEIDRIESGSALLKVCDTGIGIPADQLEAIFNEYHQIDGVSDFRQKTRSYSEVTSVRTSALENSSDMEGGLGLGLSIVSRLCDLMALKIQVESQPEIGSMFSLEIPLGEMLKVSELPEAPATVASLCARVLVIDDDQDILNATRRMLESWGCVVTTTTTLEETLQAIAIDKYPPDMVLSDYRLAQGESGIELVKTVREWLDEEIPSIIITGDTSPERLAEVSASGLPILHKPLHASDLQIAIQGLLDNYPEKFSGKQSGLQVSGVFSRAANATSF